MLMTLQDKRVKAPFKASLNRQGLDHIVNRLQLQLGCEVRNFILNFLKVHESIIYKADIQKIIPLKLGSVLFFEPENLGLNRLLFDKVAEEI